MKSDLKIIDDHIAAGADEKFILNCLLASNVKLVEAVENNYINIVKFMINHGVNVGARNNWSLRWACGRGQIEIINLILETGVSSNIIDEALVWACQGGQLEVVKLLIIHGADVHYKGDMALRTAKFNNHTEVAKFLEGLDKDAT